MSSRKQFLGSLCIPAFLFVVFPLQSSAQQITSPTVPETSSPQSTRSDLFNINTGVQESSDSTVLNETPSSISIDSGTPAASPEIVTEPSNAFWKIVLVIGVCIALVAWVLLALSSDTIQAPIVSDVPEEPVAPKPAAKKPAKPKPASKKKKRRSKKKSTKK